MKGNYDFRISSYFALAMLEMGINKKQVKQIVSLAHIKMDEMDPEESYRKAIEKMGGR